VAAVTSSQVATQAADISTVTELHPDLRPEDMGARLRAVRELSGANTRDVAKSAGLSRRELQAAERGVKRLSPDQLHALAGALSVDPEVLVGVGFAGELVRAGTVEDRIDRVVGHDPDQWDDLPASVDDLPPALPVNLPNPERRKDYETRRRIEQSWRDIRNEMGDTLTSCARLISAGSGDDVRRLIDRLERDLQQLKTHRMFQRNLADHERALHKARSAGPNFAGQALASSANEAR
jgi:transcriptional regulator with XRE-family HTH domain